MADFVMKCCHFVWVRNLLLLHAKECNECQSKSHAKNEENTDRDQSFSFYSQVWESKVASNNTSCHTNGENEKVEFPWHINFSNAVNLLQITHDLFFRFFGHMMDIKANFTCFRTEVFFWVFYCWAFEFIRFQLFKRYRKDNTVPSDICVPIIRLKHFNNNSNITNLL